MRVCKVHAHDQCSDRSPASVLSDLCKGCHPHGSDLATSRALPVLYLVSADNHSPDAGCSVDGRDCHEGNDGGAVGVGNDAAFARLVPIQVVCIDLWDDQGNALCHPKGRAVVHHLPSAQQGLRDEHL